MGTLNKTYSKKDLIIDLKRYLHGDIIETYSDPIRVGFNGKICNHVFKNEKQAKQFIKRHWRI